MLCRLALGLPAQEGAEEAAADAVGEAAADGEIPVGQTGDTGSAEDEIRKCDLLQQRLQAALEHDSVMQSHAGKAIVVQHLKRGDLFDACTTKDAFKERLKDLQACATETKTIAQALRRCVAEITSMIKAGQHPAEGRPYIKGFGVVGLSGRQGPISALGPEASKIFRG